MHSLSLGNEEPNVYVEVMGKPVLITTFGSLGDLHPYLALAIGLKARGHAPVIATSELYRGVIEQDGIGFHPVRPDIDPNDHELIKKALHPRLGPEFLILEVLLPRSNCQGPGEIPELYGMSSRPEGYCMALISPTWSQ